MQEVPLWAASPRLPGGHSGCSRLGGIPFFRDAVQIHISSMKDCCPRREGPADPPHTAGWDGENKRELILLSLATLTHLALG